MSLVNANMASNNFMNNMNLGGYAGKRLAANESAWLHHVLENNPNMFEAFANPEGNNLAKCMWHGEFPGKILTGMAQTLRAFRNPKTLVAGNKMVQMFKSVQGTVNGLFYRMKRIYILIITDSIMQRRKRLEELESRFYKKLIILEMEL